MYNSNVPELGFTPRQTLFFEWLMQSLGFIDDETTWHYVWALRRRTFRYRTTRKIPKSLFFQIYTPSDGQYYREQIQELKRFGFRTVSSPEHRGFGSISYALSEYYSDYGEYFVPTRYELIDFLADEYRLKTHNLINRQERQSQSISATDIANFTYCPVGYSISKTYNQESTIMAEVGTAMHNEQFLSSLKGHVLKIKTSFWGSSKDRKPQILNDAFNENIVADHNVDFFVDLQSAELVHVGSKPEPQKFRNNFLGYIGVPDYIFKRGDGRYFVVEEKFILMTSNSGIPVFFDNHLEQLSSYVTLINDINIDYGYLVYWLYLFEGGQPKIKRCFFRKIPNTKAGFSAVSEKIDLIRNLNSGNVWSFKRDNVFMTKCAGCIYNRICGHNKGRYNTFRFPYDAAHLQIFHSPSNQFNSSEIQSLQSADDLPF